MSSSNVTPKQLLNNWATKNHLPPPRYETVPFNRGFSSRCTVEEPTMSWPIPWHGAAATKRGAEQTAALHACAGIDTIDDDLSQFSKLELEHKCIGAGMGLPVYKSSITPSHKVENWVATCTIHSKPYCGEGRGTTQAEAENHAARDIHEFYFECRQRS